MWTSPVMFLIVAIIFGLLGFTGVLGWVSGVAQFLFVVFLGAYVYTSIRSGKPPAS